MHSNCYCHPLQEAGCADDDESEEEVSECSEEGSEGGSEEEDSEEEAEDVEGADKDMPSLAAEVDCNEDEGARRSTRMRKRSRRLVQEDAEEVEEDEVAVLQEFAAAQHGVLTVAEDLTGAEDEHVLAGARQSGRPRKASTRYSQVCASTAIPAMWQVHKFVNKGISSPY